MIITATAKRYAKALFDLAQEQNRLEPVLAEFEAFLSMIEADAELSDLLEYPDDIQREKVITELFKDRFSPLFFNFLLLVLKNKRSHFLRQIFLDYRERNDRMQNRVRAIVTTAVPLSEEKRRELVKNISGTLKADVVIENTVDDSILGGIIITIDGQEFNASLAEHFKKLKLNITKN